MTIPRRHIAVLCNRVIDFREYMFDVTGERYSQRIVRAMIADYYCITSVEEARGMLFDSYSIIGNVSQDLIDAVKEKLR